MKKQAFSNGTVRDVPRKDRNFLKRLENITSAVDFYNQKEEILKRLGGEDVPADVQKIVEEMSASFSRTLTPSRQHILWGDIKKSGITKLAVAAAIIIAFGIGFSIGQRSKPTQLAIYSLDVSGYTPAVPVYPTAPKAEGSFWRQKILAAMQPRPYAQTLTTKISLFNTYKQYLKEKHYD